MSLAEGVQGLIAYSAYASGAISPNTEDLAPPTTSPKGLRRVSSSLNLKKTTYTSQEIRSDRQIADYRHGPKHVDGDIVGELSPGTYFDFFEAVHRDTRAQGVSASQADFTSVAASTAGTFTLGGGNPVTKGFQVGDIIAFTGNTNAALDNVNHIITGFGGTNNETVNVWPYPSANSTASTTFTMTGQGYSTYVPPSGQVSRKFGVEIYHEDVGISRLFTEMRASKYALRLPATGIAEATFSFMGRDEVLYTSPSAPYYATPAADTTTTVVMAINGLLLLNGTQVGVVTGVDLQCDLKPVAAEVVGQTFPAEIFLGRADVTGQLSAYLTDTTLFGDFLNETELQLLLQASSGTAANAASTAFFLPRIKLGGADLALQGEAGQMITAPFQALRYLGTSPGVPSTTIRICDTQAVA